MRLKTITPAKKYYIHRFTIFDEDQPNLELAEVDFLIFMENSRNVKVFEIKWQKSIKTGNVYYINLINESIRHIVIKSLEIGDYIDTKSIKIYGRDQINLFALINFKNILEKKKNINEKFQIKISGRWLVFTRKEK